MSLDLHYQMAEIGRLIGAYQYVACLRLVLMKSVAGSILSWSQQGGWAELGVSLTALTDAQLQSGRVTGEHQLYL